MLSLSAAASTSSSSSFHLLRLDPSRSRFSRIFLCFSAANSESTSPEQQPFVRANHGGFRLEETVEGGAGKSRLDSWITSRIQDVSRARIQFSIRSGLVSVNGRIIEKVSHTIREGDKVSCTVSELQPLRADPEDLPLDIVYEDDHVLVVNKPAHLVVHPAPGNPSGTLVNAVLHHCKLPAVACTSINRCSEREECPGTSEDCFDYFSDDHRSREDTKNWEALIRPGIVHRLDKGTSGLLVIAKDEHSHARLAEQFKQHTIHRVYISITSGVPSQLSGRIEVPIARDSNNRIRMAAVPGAVSSKNARYAASRYRVVEELVGGACALVEWSLETGRTHQIRAHAKYLGIPLLGDEVYGATKSMALSILGPRTPSCHHEHISRMISILDRPCLHALSLGFKHPRTGKHVQFSRSPPADFSEVLDLLRRVSNVSVES